MIFQRNSTIPQWLWYCLYLCYYNLTHIIMSAIFCYIIEIPNPLFHIQSFFAISFFYWMWLPYLIPLISWRKVGSMVDSVEIDREKRQVKMVYYSFIFWKKEVTFFIDDNFQYN